MQDSKIVKGRLFVTNVKKISDLASFSSLYFQPAGVHLLCVEKGFFSCTAGPHPIRLHTGGVLCLTGDKRVSSPFLSEGAVLYYIRFCVSETIGGEKNWIFTSFPFLNMEKEGPPYHIQLSPIAQAKGGIIFAQIEKESKNGEEGADIACLAYMLELFTLLLRSRPSPGEIENPNVPLVFSLIDIFEKEYQSSLTLDDLCQRLSLSKSKLLTSFKYATGKTPMAYLAEVRMKHAMDLLATTDLSITDIAYLTGFPDSNYFIRKFHQHMGTTPLKFRKNPMKDF